MDKIYITHCSATKDPALKGTGIKTTPDMLYTAAFIKRLVKSCRENNCNWAIFSDKYAVVFPDDRIAWYEKDPNDVTEAEYQALVDNFVTKLGEYKAIWFYHNPGRFHRLYKRLVQDVKQRGLKIILFSHIDEIG